MRTSRPGESTAEVTIDVPSVESGSQAHDDHLRSAGFFDVARHHPAATFAGRATGRRGRRGLLAGELTSRGVTRPVTLQAGYLGRVAGPRGGQRAIFTAEGTLNRDAGPDLEHAPGRRRAAGLQRHPHRNRPRGGAPAMTTG